MNETYIYIYTRGSVEFDSFPNVHHFNFDNKSQCDPIDKLSPKNGAT